MKPAESLGLTEQLVPALDFIASIHIGGIIIGLLLLLLEFSLHRRSRAKSTRRRRTRRR